MKKHPATKPVVQPLSASQLQAVTGGHKTGSLVYLNRDRQKG